MRAIALALLGALAIACGASTPQLPPVDLPTFDLPSVQRLVDEAIAEAGELTGSLPTDLPPAVRRLLEENDIRLPDVPRNAAEICQALGTPGVGTVASAGLTQLIETLAAGTEVGLVVAVLVPVIARTCPDWMPHLENALESVL